MQSCSSNYYWFWQHSVKRGLRAFRHGIQIQRKPFWSAPKLNPQITNDWARLQFCVSQNASSQAPFHVFYFITCTQNSSGGSWTNPQAFTSLAENRGMTNFGAPELLVVQWKSDIVTTAPLATQVCRTVLVERHGEFFFFYFVFRSETTSPELSFLQLKAKTGKKFSCKNKVILKPLPMATCELTSLRVAWQPSLGLKTNVLSLNNR